MFGVTGFGRLSPHPLSTPLFAPARLGRPRWGRHLFRDVEAGHRPHKAHQRGAYLECRVQVGKVKTVSANGDPSITCRSLRREGYDSVLIPRQNGHEYVVYDWAQVKSVRRV